MNVGARPRGPLGRLGLWLLLMVGCLGSAVAHGADRVLIVGVGQFALPGNDLPGIDLDVELAKEAAAYLGFAPSAVRVLLDKDATARRVKDALSTWVVDGVGPEDHVFIYFSSHGTQITDQNGEEADGLDEVIVLHDTGVSGGRLINALVDDELAVLLARIPSRNVTVAIDTCHSGTATRSLPLQAATLRETTSVPKLMKFAELEASGGHRPSTGTRGAAADGGMYDEGSFKGSGGVLTLSAAQDNELARATNKGSLFTLGLRLVLSQAVRQGARIAAAVMVDLIAQYILAEGGRQRPSGSGSRLSEPMRLQGAAAPNPSPSASPSPQPAASTFLRSKFEALVRSAPEKLGLKANRSKFRLSEDMTLMVDVPRSGYLNVVSIDAKDEGTVLFPNQHHPSNRVEAGTVTIPSETMGFALRAQEPVGPTYVAAFWTEQPLDAHAMGTGPAGAAFAELSAKAVRGFGVVATQRGARAGGLNLGVTR